MLRIALSGTNWTGKSTTIDTYVSRNPEVSIDVHSLSALVKKCPYPMVQNQTIDGSIWMAGEITKLIKSPADSEIQIFDRSPIDIMAFTHYAMDREHMENADDLISSILNLITYFDHLFFCEHNGNWPTTKQSQQDVLFALSMDNYIRGAISKYEIKNTKLPWDLEERQTILQNVIHQGKSQW